MSQTPLFAARTKRKMLPYFVSSTVSCGSGTAGSYILSANGLFDPDISSTGTQPSGFDQMMVFYEHYTVYQARIVVTFRATNAGISPIVFVAARGDTANIPSIQEVMNTGNTVATQLMPLNIDGSLKELKMIVNVASFLGFDDLADSNVSRGDINANPAEGVFFHIGLFNPESVGGATINFQARVTYEAVFSEARVVTPSLREILYKAVVSDSPIEVKSSPPLPVPHRR